MAGFLRALGVNRRGAGLAGIVYQLSGFMIASAVFPMMVAAAVWLPLVLWMIENILRGRSLWIFRGTALLWVAIGALALGCNILAGHIELTIYTLLIAGYYAAFRLVLEFARRWRRTGSPPLRWAFSAAIWLLALVALGIGLAALQLIPLYEFVGSNWRAERSSLETALGYAHPIRDFAQFLLPNVYGSPAHQSYVDVFSGELVSDLRDAAGASRDFIYWGIKNYVEGALYVGVLPLAFAAFALLTGWRRGWASWLALFGLLAGAALSFMFGAATYSLVFQLPGMNQLNSPFRWVFALTLATAALAGIGLHLLCEVGGRWRRVALLFGLAQLVAGLGLLLGVAAIQAEFARFEPLLNRLVTELAGADRAFADGRMFFSYLQPQLLTLGGLLLVGGVLFLGLAWRRSWLWASLALIVTAVDLLIASYGFNPASDPLLLDFKPPAIEFLQGQAGRFRVTSLERPGDGPILPPNTGMRFGIDDIRGYDSIIPAAYVATMRALQPQHLLAHNQIAPLYTDESRSPAGYQRLLRSDLLRLLNVRYALTAPDFEMRVPGWSEVYRQEVAIWENESVMPRAFAVY